MSDIRYDVFQHYGTAAERAAFVPAPAAGIQPVYVWYETDTGKLWVYHTSWTQVVGSGTVPTPLSYLVSGGAIVWTGSYNFTVSAANYYILGIAHASPQTDIVLSAADPANPRIDVVVVNDGDTVAVVEGTPAVNPSEPDINPSTQLKLGIILVPGAGAPSGTNEDVYIDNAGPPGEWTWTSSGASINVDSVNNPRGGSAKDIEGTTVVNGVYAQGEKGVGTINPNNFILFILYIRSKALWSSGRSLIVSLRNNGVLVGNNITIARNGTWGFDSAVVGSYQLVAIPISSFAIPVGSVINQVRVTASGAGHGFYIDDIIFQTSANTPTPIGGITQTEADARYLRRANNLTDLDSAATATAQLSNMIGDGGAGGTKGLVPAPAAGDTAAGKYLKADGNWTIPPTSAGDVVGPAGAINEHLAVFDGESGKAIKDGGAVPSIANAVTAGAVIGDNRLIRGEGGARGAQSSGVTLDDTDNITGVASVAVGGALSANAKATFNGQYNSPEVGDGNSGAAKTLDWANGNEHYLTLTDNVTLTFNNPITGGRYVLLVNTGVGGFDVTWPATVKWSGDTPVVTAAANKLDLFTFMWCAALGIYLGNYAQNYATS